MPKNYTSHFRERTGNTSGEEPVYLLEITHAQLGAPVRIVRDTQDLVSNGETFVALTFEIQLPDDAAGRLPRAPIRIDNVGRELTQWIDASQGGRGAKVRLMQVLRSDPDTIEYDVTLDLLRVTQNGAHVVGELGYEDFLSLPALVARYDPSTAPAIF